eukprot:2286895-Pyramimonas_sp.AAC.1
MWHATFQSPASGPVPQARPLPSHACLSHVCLSSPLSPAPLLICIVITAAWSLIRRPLPSPPGRTRRPQWR